VRSTFVVAQIGLALVLLAGSGLLIRSFARLVGVDPGFEAKNLLTFTVTLPNARYGTNAARMAFFRQLLDQMEKLPGVRSASMDSFPPLSGLGAATGVPSRVQANFPAADLQSTRQCAWSARIISGPWRPAARGSYVRCPRAHGMRHVAIVNQAFVDQYLPGINPAGSKMIVYMKSDEEAENAPSEIIGVVGDVRLMGLDTPAQPTVYWPHPELTMSRMTIWFARPLIRWGWFQLCGTSCGKWTATSRWPMWRPWSSWSRILIRGLDSP